MDTLINAKEPYISEDLFHLIWGQTTNAAMFAGLSFVSAHISYFVNDVLVIYELNYKLLNSI